MRLMMEAYDVVSDLRVWIAGALVLSLLLLFIQTAALTVLLCCLLDRRDRQISARSLRLLSGLL